MNHNDREHFWQTLCSLPGNDIVAEREQLFKAIKYPEAAFPVSTCQHKELGCPQNE